MSFIIRGYKDSYYIFRLCRSEETHRHCMVHGFNHLYCHEPVRLYTYDGYIDMPADSAESFNEYCEGDVFSIDEKGIVTELYADASDSNALVTTPKCNSNCVMCPIPEAVRRDGVPGSAKQLLEIIRYIPRTARHITITGGEPTLLGEGFFEVLKALQHDFDATAFQLLTNGRVFSDPGYTARFSDCIPDILEIGIPIYGYDAATHDSITRAPGSFAQTVAGIRNLLHYDCNIEIRIVLTKMVIDNMDMIADLIIRDLNEVSVVTIMGLEMTGNAARYKDLVWAPYDEMFEKSRNAINRLAGSGIDVRLYNFPLCMISEKYWGIANKSISGYKIRYSDECAECEVKEVCGGVFGSTKVITGFHGRPVKRKDQ